ncbi:MAG: cell shape determination protein CcmA [Gallionellales bacterium RBG_16_56_9]|jgi:cytoskeletal protein CcmA (bactofilin family)|nr:MAG: cell shape determination protein CcmA [Gallionellales bacterium RIFCSPLOWO2_02_FULL_57_47]OGS94196.1 MAG: cell shape determination protein CcmA [Gallionellales bacterium RIFCSPLOWO2_12_FULL_57_18]OGS98058.1 MAG: cell shape determination protein CcmA [Gallionellales bacterium RBG_16_56_9]OGT16247.1 MAG: cell shape determination protein CcmA [Gallionellales bacterium RIFCSPHIGHO2_02_FULL_57_16]
MFGKKHSKPQTQIDSLIGANATIGGDLYFSGGLRVDGHVNGNVIATPGKPSTLVLSEHARVNGEVSVTHLVTNGTINGSVSASEYLELQGKAKVTGDIYYKTMLIQLGAIIEGRLIHGKLEAEDKVVAFKAGSGE